MKYWQNGRGYEEQCPSMFTVISVEATSCTTSLPTSAFTSFGKSFLWYDILIQAKSFPQTCHLSYQLHKILISFSGYSVHLIYHVHTTSFSCRYWKLSGMAMKSCSKNTQVISIAMCSHSSNQCYVTSQSQKLV
jgi:hypothetical protein